MKINYQEKWSDLRKYIDGFAGIYTSEVSDSKSNMDIKSIQAQAKHDMCICLIRIMEKMSCN